MKTRKNALSDEKIFNINDKGELFIEDKSRSKEQQKIGEIEISTLEQKALVNTPISLSEIKDVWDDHITLSEPEKFVQILLSKTQYTKENGWIQEYGIEDLHNETKRFFDLARIVDNKIIVGGIENKNAMYLSNDKTTTDSNFKKQANSGFQQIKRYFDHISQKNKKRVLVGAVYVYDADFFFNNPNHINNLTHYIYYNTDFFRTINIVYDPRKKYSHKEEEYMSEMTVQGTGLIDVIKVEKHEKIKEINEQYVLVYPEELRELNRESNPRSEELAKSTALARDIVRNMIDAINGGLEYYATKYTTEKQISSLEGLSYIESKLNNGGYLYGHGLSLCNGQHSNAAYYYLYQIINNKNMDNYEAPYFNKLKEDIELLKEIMAENSINIKDFNKRFLLKSKVTVAHNKKEENALAMSSNKTVGEVDTNITPLIDFIYKLDNELYIRGSKIQISVPRILKMKGYHYIDYDVLPLLKTLEESKSALQVFRIRGFDKIEDFKNDIFNLKKERAKIKENKKKKERSVKELFELEDEVKCLDEDSRVYKNTMSSIIELRSKVSELENSIYRFSNFDFDIMEEFKEKTIERMILFSKIYEKGIEKNIDDKKLLNVSKLAYVFLNQANNSYTINIDNHIEIALIFSDYFNNDILADLEMEDLGINKNSIYNSGKNGIGTEINLKVLEFIKENNLINGQVDQKFKDDIKKIIKDKLLD